LQRGRINRARATTGFSQLLPPVYQHCFMCGLYACGSKARGRQRIIKLLRVGGKPSEARISGKTREVNKLSGALETRSTGETRSTSHLCRERKRTCNVDRSRALLTFIILGFCSEVWGPTLLRGALTPVDLLENPLQRVQALFMRRLGGGLRRSTSRQLMFREFGCRPLVRGWLQGMLGLWNRMQSLPEGNLLRTVVSESLA
jgi:hypothetical protein